MTRLICSVMLFSALALCRVVYAADIPGFNLEVLRSDLVAAGSEVTLDSLLSNCDVLVLTYYPFDKLKGEDPLPGLQNLYDQYSDTNQNGDRKLAVAIVVPYTIDNASKVREKFGVHSGYTFTVLLDKYGEILNREGVTDSPITHVLKADGTEQHSYIGYFLDDISSLVAQSLVSNPIWNTISEQDIAYDLNNTPVSYSELKLHSSRIIYFCILRDAYIRVTNLLTKLDQLKTTDTENRYYIVLLGTYKRDSRTALLNYINDNQYLFPHVHPSDILVDPEYDLVLSEYMNREEFAKDRRMNAFAEQHILVITKEPDVSIKPYWISLADLYYNSGDKHDHAR
jgi:hypothetical protein